MRIHSRLFSLAVVPCLEMLTFLVCADEDVLRITAEEAGQLEQAEKKRQKEETFKVFSLLGGQLCVLSVCP